MTYALLILAGLLLGAAVVASWSVYDAVQRTMAPDRQDDVSVGFALEFVDWASHTQQIRQRYAVALTLAVFAFALVSVALVIASNWIGFVIFLALSVIGGFYAAKAWRIAAESPRFRA